ncbi:protein translocase subunit SecF, partial [Salinisphaera sp.]|uniref:protein translocase subunit SecF n=1 Tax=Salinisphaera sp. TaxID=1914330 RepID=UPI002D768A58
MFRLIKKNTKFDFVRFGKYALTVTYVLVALSVASLATGHLNFGIDFTGGAVVHVQYPHEVDLGKVRQALDQHNLNAAAQHFGSADTVIVRLSSKPDVKTAKIGQHVMNALKSGPSGAQLQGVQYVGPQVGQELVNKGSLALLYTMIAILLYVLFRFHWKLAFGAVAALVHDIFITLGVFSVLPLNFDLTVLAALLAVLGYSVNDTVVVFDRIRENFPRMRKATAPQVVNAAINQTLSRTVMTSGITLLTLFALLILGGPVLRGFSVTLIVGILVGTYSSIFIASPIALALKLTAHDLFPPKEEDAEKASK